MGDREERRVAVDGATLRYLDRGEGHPVVLVHGDGESASSDWFAIVGELSRSYRLIAPDLLLGNSPARSADYSVGALSRLVVGLLDALGIEEATLVGHSLGGLVALRAALRWPERIDALVLASSVGLGREINPLIALSSLPGYGELAVAWSGTPLGAEQRALARSLLLFARPDRAAERWWDEQRRLARTPGFLTASLTAQRSIVGPWGQRDVVLDDLTRLAVPVLVVWGDRDLVVPLAHARRAMDRLPDGRLAVLPGCGHVPQLEHPDEFIAALDDFLADERAGGA
ncbi:MAG: alpha/beta fold hydrolase [Actinomycetota bacterium]|nr:alpha/beta fold hydrolase [Actinomycetota bacterium]